MNGDDIAVLHPQVVADDSVYPRGTVVEIIICKHYENCVLALFALDKNGVATEELQRLHGVVRKCNNRVVIVDSIGDAVQLSVLGLGFHRDGCHLHKRVGLLLLLEDGSCYLVLLRGVSGAHG